MQQGAIEKLLKEIKPPRVSAWKVSEIVAGLDQSNLKFRIRDMESVVAQSQLVDLTEDNQQDAVESSTPKIKIIRQEPGKSKKSPRSIPAPPQHRVSVNPKRQKLVVPSPKQDKPTTGAKIQTNVEVAIYRHPQTIPINTAESIDEIWKAHWKRFIQVRDSTTPG